MAHFNSIARQGSKSKRSRAQKIVDQHKLQQLKKRGRPAGSGQPRQPRVPGARESKPRKSMRMSADDILNSKSPKKKVKEINPYAPGGALYDRTMSINYDA